MSQNHVLLKGSKGDVYVVMGYDRPLGQLFCNVSPDDDDDTDYSGLMFRQFADVAQIKQALQEVGLTVPATVLAVVEDDERQQTGNVLRKFDAEGFRIQ